MNYHHRQVTLSVRAPPTTGMQDISHFSSQRRQLEDSLTRSDYRCDSVCGSHQSCHGRSFLGCKRDPDDNVRSSKSASNAQTCYSPSDNESCAILCNSYFTLRKSGALRGACCHTAYQTPNLEYTDAQQVDCFNREIFESFPPNRLSSRNSQEQGGRIPSYIRQAVKLVGYVRNSCGNNCLLADCQPLEPCPERSYLTRSREACFLCISYHQARGAASGYGSIPRTYSIQSPRQLLGNSILSGTRLLRSGFPFSRCPH